MGSTPWQEWEQEWENVALAGSAIGTKQPLVALLKFQLMTFARPRLSLHTARDSRLPGAVPPCYRSRTISPFNHDRSFGFESPNAEGTEDEPKDHIRNNNVPFSPLSPQKNCQIFRFSFFASR